jgi:hypothetical protein
MLLLRVPGGKFIHQLSDTTGHNTSRTVSSLRRTLSRTRIGNLQIKIRYKSEKKKLKNRKLRKRNSGENKRK